jgi:hypothetical protein
VATKEKGGGAVATVAVAVAVAARFDALSGVAAFSEERPSSLMVCLLLLLQIHQPLLRLLLLL